MAVQKVIEVRNNLFGNFDLLAEDRTTSSVTAAMNPGEPVKRAGTGTNFVAPLATGDPEIGTDLFVGIVSKQSTETSTADGRVNVALVGLGSLLRGHATTPSNMDTQAELDGLMLDFVAFDVTALTGTNGDFTIDEDEGTDPNVHGLMIIGGDIEAGLLDVVVTGGTIFESTV